MIPALVRTSILLFVMAVAWGEAAEAHELQPGYLEVGPVGEESFRVVWRVPDVRGAPMAIEAQLPETCAPRNAPPPGRSAGAWTSVWVATCPGGLVGGRIEIAGLERTRTDVLVRATLEAGADAHTRRLTSTETGFDILANPGTAEIFLAYVRLGFEHILEGADHLLFVFVLMLLVPDWWRLAGAITSFTLAHSVSLAAATFGLVRVPGPPVETVIALSIMVLAAEYMKRDPSRPSLTERRPWAICFPFGLLHGLGFAGALAEIGLPEADVPASLLAFNLGVEAGQLAFVAAVILAGMLLRRIAGPTVGELRRADSTASLALAYVVGGVSGFWFVERVASF